MVEPGRPLGFLVVGAGFLGSARAAAVVASRGARLVGVVDTDVSVASAVASRHGVASSTDYASMLDHPDVDAVIVATPHADHAAQTEAALNAGKHVLCEKPLTVEPSDARRLATLADRLRLRLATGLNHRLYPPVRDALEMAAAWAVGRVEGVRAQIGHRASPAFLSSWHTDVARSGGGTFMDNGPHACDLVRLFLGEVTAAKGYCREAIALPRQCEMEACALFRDFDQRLGEVRSSWHQPTGYLTIEVRGSEGWLLVETAPWRLTGVLASGRRVHRGYLAERVAERLFRTRFGCERSLVQEVEAFVRPTSPEHPRVGATGWDGCRVSEMIDAVYRSNVTGDEVVLDPLPVTLPSQARRQAARRVA